MKRRKERPQRLFKKYKVVSRDTGETRGQFKSRAKANRRRDRLNKTSSQDWYVHGVRR